LDFGLLDRQRSVRGQVPTKIVSAAEGQDPVCKNADVGQDAKGRLRVISVHPESGGPRGDDGVDHLLRSQHRMSDWQLRNGHTGEVGCASFGAPAAPYPCAGGGITTAAGLRDY
jgi:hypothetical protein